MHISGTAGHAGSDSVNLVLCQGDQRQQVRRDAIDLRMEQRIFRHHALLLGVTERNVSELARHVEFVYRKSITTRDVSSN